MNPVLFVTDYIRWHYGSALFSMLRVWGNFLWFILHISSTRELLATLFSPWKRMHEEKPPKGTFDPEYYIGSITINLIMRVVGMVVRLFVIVMSFIIFGFLFIGGVLFVAFWFVAPVAIFLMFFSGLSLVTL